MLKGGPAREPLVEPSPVAQGHARDLPMDVEAPDPRQIQSYLSARLPFSPRVLSFSQAGLYGWAVVSCAWAIGTRRKCVTTPKPTRLGIRLSRRRPRTRMQSRMPVAIASAIAVCMSAESTASPQPAGRSRSRLCRGSRPSPRVKSRQRSSAALSNSEPFEQSNLG